MNNKVEKVKRTTLNTLDPKSLREQFKVDGIIRIHSNEFRFLPLDKDGFYNFYFGDARIEVGKRYLVVKIVRRGARFIDKPDIEPRLSLSGHFFVTCKSVENDILPRSLTTSFFQNTFTNIKNAGDLLSVLERRYKTSRPSLKKEDFSKSKITVSFLDIEKK